MNTPNYSSAGALTPTQVAYLQNAALNGVIGQVLLGSKIGANMNSTSDQAITINNTTKYVIRKILVTNASTSLTTAVGGFYAAASKTTALVANTQIFTALSAAAKYLDITLGALLGTDVRTETTLYLSLTIAQGATATADIYIFGDKLD